MAAATVASVAVVSAGHGTKTTSAVSPLAAAVDPGLVDVTATLGYQQAISAGTGMVMTKLQPGPRPPLQAWPLAT